MLTPSTSPAEQPPAILQITIERIHPGSEVRYGELEERMAETCVRLDCPNSYLALESVAAPKEVWWLVEYAAEAEAFASRLGPSARVFRVQPSWSRPAERWVAANPELWQRR